MICIKVIQHRYVLYTLYYFVWPTMLMEFYVEKLLIESNSLYRHSTIILSTISRAVYSVKYPPPPGGEDNIRQRNLGEKI